jgi:proline-specific peptidase
MAPLPPSTTGEIPFHPAAAGKPCKTWYRLFGDLKSGVRPLVTLHGGPGAASNYLTPLADMTALYGIPVILYDQCGTGESTHLPEKKGDTSFWTVDLFLEELDNLLAHLGIQHDYDLLGQSWGGMLAACHAVRQPKGLHTVTLADSPSDMVLFVQECNKLREQLPSDVQDTLLKHEREGTTDSKEYEQAVQVFNERHLCRIVPMPPDAMESMRWIERDPTVYHTMYVIAHPFPLSHFLFL